MVNQKKPKKLLAIVLAALMLLSTIPAGVLTTVFAAASECLAVEVEGVKVYFYGVETLEVNENTVKYTGGDNSDPALYIGGVVETTADPEDVAVEDDSITFKAEWLAAQTEWIAVQCDSSVDVPSSEPSVEVDTTAPEIADDGVSYSPTTWTNSDVTLSVTATDNETGVVTYSIDNSTWQDENEFTLTNNGEYTVYVKNAVGLVSSKTVTISCIDKVNPTVSIQLIPNNDGKPTNAAVTLIVTAQDNENGSGIADNGYQLDGGEWTSETEYLLTDTDEHTICVKDNAGNYSDVVTFNSTIYDGTKPVVTAVTPQEETWSNGEKLFNVAANDVPDNNNIMTGVAEYKMDDGDWQTEATFPIGDVNEHTFYAKDNAGNISDGFVAKSVWFDNQIPNAPVVVPSTTAPTNEPVTLTVSAQDEATATSLASGIAKYQMDDNTPVQADENGNAVFTVADSKTHKFYAYDEAGNVSEVTEFAATNYDAEKPVVTDTTPSTTVWTNNTIVVEVSGEDNAVDNCTANGIAKYQIDNETPVAADNDGKAKFNINDAKTHSFYAYDEAGNKSAAKEFTAINYDAKAPELDNSETAKAIDFDQKNDNWLAKAMNKLTFGRFFNEKLVITINAKDVADDISNASGIVNVKFIFNDSKTNEYTEFTAAVTGNKETVNIEPITITKDALPENFKGTASVILVDAAGNGADNKIAVTTDNSNMGDIDGDSEFNFMIERNAPEISTPAPATEIENNISKSDFTLSFNVNDKIESADNEEAKIPEYSGIAWVSVLANGVEVAKNGAVIDYTEDKVVDQSSYDIVVKDDYTINGVKFTKEQWKDGVIEFVVIAADNAGNVTTTEAVTYTFDQTAPEITEFKIGGKTTSDYVEVNDYGFYFKKETKITISAEDFAADKEFIKSNDKYERYPEATASGLKAIAVYLKDINGTLYSVSKNKDVISKIESINDVVPVDTNDSITFTIPEEFDFKGQIYAYAVDNAGNSHKAIGNENENPIYDCKYFYDANVDEDGYVHPDGTIVETLKMHSGTSTIEFVKIPTPQGTQNNSSHYKYEGDAQQQDANMDYVTSIGKDNVPLYNAKGEIKFDVKVTDSYSGIKEVTYTIIEGNEKTVKTVELDNDGNFTGEQEGWNITKQDENLVTEMTNTIGISGNYNDMSLTIELTDRAGNKSYDYYVFGIDHTAPEITVTYSNNSADTQSGKGSYFKENRTATILVKERNFNPENVEFTVKNAEGDAPEVVYKGIATKDAKDNNGDGNVYKYEIKYTEDGVYKFDVKYTDRATNKASVDYKDSVAPKSFVIDKTAPTITVVYDNNESAAKPNDKYFKANRTATITIVEHNFDVNRVLITQTSNLNGRPIENPAVTWKDNGDTHFATIRYDKDGDYTFDIHMTDMADNNEKSVDYSSSVAANDFVIDTTYSDIVKVDGIVDTGVLGLSSEGKLDDNAKISITINDINLDSYNIKLTRSRVIVEGESYNEDADVDKENVKDNPGTQCSERDIDVTEEFVSKYAGTENGVAEIVIPKRNKDGVKNDGLYTLRIEAKDKAGNAYDTENNVITFSVNRFGSVFTFGDELYKLLTENDGYTQKVSDKDLKIYEYNATTVTSNKVEVIAGDNSNVLTAKDDYKVEPDKRQTDTSWNKYTYSIFPKNFASDGTYTLNIMSNDRTNNTSDSSIYSVCSATFNVDSTPADITSVSYSTDVKKKTAVDKASAVTDALTVSFKVYDFIRIETIEVYVNEQLEKTYKYGEDFTDVHNFYDGEFVIKDGGAQTQTFDIVVTDKAGNKISTANGYEGADGKHHDFEPGYPFFDNLVVSPSALAQFYADKVLFFGTIGGVALVTGLIIFFVVKKRKKNDDQPAK